ncbi:Hypothetical protein R9X50_00424700 [Acrodontium crateriforme]|uniref:UBX domain-containing protein n=1 Tax=Acrodontium crateriforme TaxID=150365 RepID=A0AAQ3M5Q7_9PEZI|nr:Hypothetical protein R9X50_00424700 [Acrodontium crateriforme]
MATLPSMFHEGDLNSGISAAISQNKLVACFVRQEGEYWSRIWEEYWLQNLDQQWDEQQGPPLAQLMYDKAVILRIEGGSKEADFLNAFCPIAKVPTLVIIHNGKVLEKVEAGVERDEFIRKISKAIGVSVPADVEKREQDRESRLAEAAAQSSPTTQTQGVAAPAQTQPAHSSSVENESTSQRSEQPAATAAVVPPQPENVQALLNERAQRLEASRLEREAAEKAERSARLKREAEEAAAYHRGGKGKQPAKDEGEQFALKSRADWLQQQKQKKDEAKRERERILERIEADKLERKLRSQRQKENEAVDANASLSFAPESTLKSSGDKGKKLGGKTALQVRLLDGSSIRSRFDADTATLSGDVRSWIKERSSAGQHAVTGSYSFRHVLPLKPARAIDVTEESKTLRELELVPDATLVLVPMVGSGSEAGGVVSKIFNMIWNFILALVTLIGSIFGLTSSNPPTGNSQATPSVDIASTGATIGATTGSSTTTDDSSKAKIRVKTLADQRAEAEGKKGSTEFYNGNSLGFQSRDKNKEDDSGKKEQ